MGEWFKVVFHPQESRFHFMGPLLHLTFHLASSLIRAECALFCDEPTLFHVPRFASFIAVFDRVHATTKSVFLLSLSRKGASPSAAAYTSSANHFSLRVNVPEPQALIRIWESPRSDHMGDCEDICRMQPYLAANVELAIWYLFLPPFVPPFPFEYQSLS